MGLLPQTPTDSVVSMTLMPYLSDQAIMCSTCIFADDMAEEIYHLINQWLNGQLVIDDMVHSTRSLKGQPMQKEGQETLIGYQME